MEPLALSAETLAGDVQCLGAEAVLCFQRSLGCVYLHPSEGRTQFKAAEEVGAALSTRERHTRLVQQPTLPHCSRGNHRPCGLRGEQSTWTRGRDTPSTSNSTSFSASPGPSESRLLSGSPASEGYLLPGRGLWGKEASTDCHGEEAES